MAKIIHMGKEPIVQPRICISRGDVQSPDASLKREGFDAIEAWATHAKRVRRRAED
ncbi:hypothetical protein PHLCEN_2v12679 [Hermanssonia centrifuga]|uniref:Uncharacterized protein n=1 Tax=Hermanssonia centrifuga TaxID=98765 RepID=A0A2R6NHE6_9APHY|nr:hypothetical protein PHLCEN_2v12679 [Hermanssonia centrifuga]